MYRVYVVAEENWLLLSLQSELDSNAGFLFCYQNPTFTSFRTVDRLSRFVSKLNTDNNVKNISKTSK